MATREALQPSIDSKITSAHLARDAYLYIRQSTMHQVMEHSESTRRQYALRERALVLGWQREQIVVLDSDLGQSGASSDREGFQKMVAQVGMGQVGVVLGLEVSRLARNNADWHRLLQICALADTLIVDEDGIYNPCDFNDRLVLGLKGTMSEAELHLLRSRLLGGLRNRAQRGELRLPLPVGLTYDLQQRVVLNPNARVRSSIQLIFDTFERTGSACATVRHFQSQGLLLPHYGRGSPRHGEVFWKQPALSTVLCTLHNPRYAGAYAYGRTEVRQLPDGTCRHRKIPQHEWRVLLKDFHPGYISWEQFERNQRTLQNNCNARNPQRSTPPREGAALLQGLVICGCCGRRMTVRYYRYQQQSFPIYQCQSDGIEHARRICQSIRGRTLDRDIGERLVELVSPLSVEATLALQAKLQDDRNQVQALHQRRVQQAQEEADLARRRFMMSEPEHRLVTQQLEYEWNEKLRELHTAQEQLEQKRSEIEPLSDEQMQRLWSLSKDFKALWHDSKTPQRERKRMVRLLVQDVTLKQEQNIIHVGLRYRGGKTEQLTLAASPKGNRSHLTPPAVIKEIDRLAQYHGDAKIAELLNQQGLTSGTDSAFNYHMVRQIRITYGVKSRRQRLREEGFLTAREVAEQLNISTTTVYQWHRKGLLTGHAYNEQGNCLYEPPSDSIVPPKQGRPVARRHENLKMRSKMPEMV